MRISREIEVDIDVELSDVLEYIEGCYSNSDLNEIKEAVLDELEVIENSEIHAHIRNTQNYETANQAFINAVNRGVDLNLLINILTGLV